MAARPRVFISYSHDSDDHKAKVSKLAVSLRGDGCEVVLDQDEKFPERGWTVWMQTEIDRADFVLVVCTETYRKRAEGVEDPPVGAGVSWEGGIIRVDLYEANRRNRKFIPVIVRPEDREHRPRFLRDYSFFLVTDRDSYTDLLALLNPEGAPPVRGTPWNVPSPTQAFSGREEYLAELGRLLSTGTPAAVTPAIRGLGGMGKTQTALEYARRHRAEYPGGGFWTVADSKDTLLSGFAEFARLLDLPLKDVKEIEVVARAAKRWFEEQHGRWLLILDNIEDWSAVKEWLPSGHGGAVVITTRLQATGTLARALDLPNMTPEEGARFLLDRGKIEHPSAADEAAAREISIELGGLPLALEQAGAYIEEVCLSPAEYLDAYRNYGRDLRARGSAFSDHETVTRTFNLAFERLGQRAREILRAVSVLAPEAIPEEILTGGSAADREFREAVAEAAKYSLIRRDPATRTIDVHRLVQEVVKDGMDPATERDLVESLAGTVAKLYPGAIEFANWAQCERLMPHARALAASTERLGIESVDIGLLFHQTAWYLLDRGRYAEAELAIDRALSMRERLLGQEHPETAKSVNNLAGVLQEQGRISEAEPLFRRALAINEKVLGANHEDTATSINNLANLLVQLWRPAEAEPLFQRALSIQETVQGPNHPMTAVSLNNLGVQYMKADRYSEAEPLLRRALQIAENVAGPEHPATANYLASLGRLYLHLKRYTESNSLLLRSLSIREAAFGRDHPHVADSLMDLAALSRAVADQTGEEERLLLQALRIRETVLGPEHMDVSYVLQSLASHYGNLGRAGEAETHLKGTLAIRERVLGPDNPGTADVLEDLGVFYASLGRFAVAQEKLRRALTILERAVDRRESDMWRVAKHYGRVLRALKFDRELRKLRERFPDLNL